MEFKQPANKQARTQDEHNRAKTLSRVIAITIKHNWQAIVSNNNGSEPISSVILPCSFTKSLCGLVVMHTYQFKLNDGRIPAVV